MAGIVPKLRVTFADGDVWTYSVRSDRRLVMSYFKDCAGFPQYFSRSQVAKMRNVLDWGKRRHLIA